MAQTDERHTMFLDWKNQYCKNDHAIQSNLQIQYNPYKMTNGILHRIRTNKFSICEETQKTTNSQNNLEGKKNKLEESGSLTSDYTTKLQ